MVRISRDGEEGAADKHELNTIFVFQTFFLIYNNRKRFRKVI